MKTKLFILFAYFLPLVLYSQSYKTKADKLLTSKFSKGPGCSALIIEDSEDQYSFVKGYADIESKKKISIDSKFEIGSITKQFTAVCILLLEERKLLNLQDSIQKFIPTFPFKEHKITIEHLLTHTSGIVNYTKKIANFENVTRYHSADSLMAQFMNSPLEFKPGAKMKYSNSGYLLLGLIIENITRQTYNEFLHQEILDKAGMSNTHTNSITSTIGYTKNGGAIIPSIKMDGSFLLGAGNIISTIHDISKWYKFLFTSGLISNPSLNKALTSHVLENGKKIKYGYGWYVMHKKGVTIITHDGGTIGFKTSVVYIPEYNTLIAVFSNCFCYKTFAPTYKLTRFYLKSRKNKKYTTRSKK